MGVQKAFAYVGLAKQAAKGAPAAAPTYGFGVRSGSLVDHGIAADYEDYTLSGASGSDRFAPDLIRASYAPAAKFSVRAHPRLLALLMYAALGTNVDSGAAPSFVHTATPGLDLPWLTMWVKYGAEISMLTDLKLAEVDVKWTERGAPEIDVTAAACDAQLGAAAFVPVNDEVAQPFFRPVGGTFKYDVLAAGGGAVGRIKAGEVKITNALTAIPLSSLPHPDDLFPGGQKVEGMLTVTPDDLTDWRRALTGAAAGTGIATSPSVGSMALLMALDANTSWELDAAAMSWLTDLPDADPKGGPADLALAFKVKRPADGSAAFTSVVKNALAAV